MVTRVVLAAAVAVAGVSLAVAADAVKIELKDFKFKPAHQGSDNLLGFDEPEDKLFFYVNGTATAPVKVADDGEYTITVKASCDEAMKQKAKFKLTVGDVVVKDSFELTDTDPKEYTFTAKLKKGEPKLAIEFLNDVHKEGEYDRNLYVQAVKIEKK
jgi:hypothetical protein